VSKWNLLISWREYVFELCHFNIPSFDGCNCMLGMHRWVVLRIGRAISSDGNVCIWLLLDFVSVSLLELCSRHFFGVVIIVRLFDLFNGHFCFHRRIYCMQRMHCRVVLLDDGTIGGDWSMCCWFLFGVFSDSLLELFHWLFPSVHGVNFMFGMYYRLVLLYDGTFGCYRCLRSRIVQFFIFVGLHLLRCWDLPSFCVFLEL